MAKDSIQKDFQVGDIVNIPCIVTAITGGTQPTLSLTTKYKDFAGNVQNPSSIAAIQVIVAS